MLVVSQAYIGHLLDEGRLAVLELKLSAGHWVGAKIDSTEADIIGTAMFGASVAIAVEVAASVAAAVWFEIAIIIITVPIIVDNKTSRFLGSLSDLFAFARGSFNNRNSLGNWGSFLCRR